MTDIDLSFGIAKASTFWFGLMVLSVASAFSFREASISDLAGFAAIISSALVPSALWCWRRVHGLPIYPLFSIGTIGTFALPLIARHPLVIEYSEHERLIAALTVAATNFAGTLPWYWLSRRVPFRPSVRCLILRRTIGNVVFAVILVGAIIFNLAQMALMAQIDASIFSVLRAGVIALSNIAIFVLSYRWGSRGLPTTDRLCYATLIFGAVISTLPSALMVGALSYGLIALLGYALARSNVPWLPLVAFGATALFLQGGKEQLRDKYWHSATADPLSLADYPGMMADWIRFSFAHADAPSQPASSPDVGDSQSLIERASLLQLFLRIQQMSPDQVPYLHGGTYSIIPGLLVPRMLNDKKERTHLGTYLLAIHYDLQTTEDTVYHNHWLRLDQ